MIKKILLAAVIGTAAMFALKNTRAGSYAKEEISAAADWVDSKVPVEKKLTALRKEIKALDKEIDKAGDELAKEIVETDYLAADIGKETHAISTEEKKVQAIGASLRGGTEPIAYGKYSVSLGEAKQLLADDVKRLVDRKATLATMSDTLASRERIKETLVKQVDGIKAQKRELTAAVDRLEADYKRLQLQQIESKYQFDDTKLADVKKSLKDLQKEIDIKRTKLKQAPTVASESGAPATGLSVDDILAPLAKKTN